MKFTVSKASLNDAIKKVINAISTKVTLPVLNNILLEADGDTLSVSASDLEIFIKTTIPAVILESGATTLPSKKFAQIISDFPNGDVTVETNEEDCATITCCRSRFKLHGLPAINYQKPDEFTEDWSFTLPAKDLLDNLAKVSYARSDDDQNRRVLNGVLFSVRAGTITIAATDGKRLALVEKPIATDVPADGDIILPIKVTTELPRSLEADKEVTIRISMSAVVFQTPDTIIVSRLLEGVYPNYRQVIPDTFAYKIDIKRAEFLEVLRRVSLILTNEGMSVRLELSNNCMEVQASNPQLGEANEPVDITYDGPDMKIAFNPQFFSDPLKLLSCETFSMNFTDDLSPVQLSGDEGFLYILMPMRN